jgi:hypothetical protein
MTRRRRQGLWAIFAVPLALAALTGIALVTTLTGDGWRDVISWLGLAAPILAVCWAMHARRT